ncbi:MAG: proteasome accessory factor PafA2 family protein [Thermoguttaceae bacterium]|jgi:hypothetical protein
MHRFLFSTDMELHTVVRGGGDEDRVRAALDHLLRTLWHMLPALPGPSGIFTPYGRFYVDLHNHFEAALCEADCPCLLAVLLEQVTTLLRTAVGNLRRATGIDISLGNNNHDGLLTPGKEDIWGFHENFLVDRHPVEFPLDLVLPFLVTRVYQGSGAIEFPSGNFLAGARAQCMNHAAGGSTHVQGSRAIYSTARDEHHMGPASDKFRLHLILADGHRSMFNTSLLFGASALAWKAVLYDRRLARSLPRFGVREHEWVETLRSLNCLAADGNPPRVDPLVIATQQAFLDASCRFAEQLSPAPPWVARTIGDWSATLQAMKLDDRRWLAARLDPFIKHEFFSSVLAHRGKSWADVPGNAQLCTELELLNYSYHELTDPQSYFDRLEQAGALDHRVADLLPPGAEPERYVPQTESRAKARARFIIEHSYDKDLVVDWGEVSEPRAGRRRTLWDPFAAAYSDWQPSPDQSHELQQLLAGLRGGRRRPASEEPF